MFSDRDLREDVKGNVVVPASVALLAFALLAGNGIDMAMVSAQRVKLQDVADYAAIAAAKEIALAGGEAEMVKAVAQAYVDSSLGENSALVHPVVDLENKRVTVTVSQKPATHFPSVFSEIENIKTVATAEFAGEAGNICMIGLDDAAAGALKMNVAARLTATDCGLYTNSQSPQAFTLKGNASVSSDLICVAGGFDGSPDRVDGEIITDCPTLADPLADRAKPYENDFSKTVNFFQAQYKLAVLQAKTDEKKAVRRARPTIAIISERW